MAHSVQGQSGRHKRAAAQSDQTQPQTPEAAASAAGQHSVRGMARKSSINLVGAVVAGLANLVLVVVLARSVSKADVGHFYTATSAFLLATVVAKLGTQTGLVYFVARLRALARPAEIPQCLSVALRPVLALGAGLAVVMFGVGAALHWSGSDPHTALVHELWVLAPFIPIAALSDSTLAATRGFGAMKPTVRIDSITRNLIQLGLCSVVAVTVGSPGLLVLAWAAPYVVSSVMAGFSVRRLTRRTVGELVPTSRSKEFSREFWKFTAPRALASLTQLLLQRLDIVLVAILRGPADAAVYTAATRLLVAGQMGGGAISTAVQPTLGATLSAGDVTATRDAYQMGTSWLILLTWPFYLLSIVYASLFLRLFGHGYTTAGSVVVILAASMLLATACGMVDMVLTMGGRTRWNLANTATALAVNVVVDLLLVPRYGVTGAAIGWAAAIVANNILPLIQIWYALRVQPFGRSTLTALSVTAASYGLLSTLSAVLVGRDHVLTVAISVVVVSAVFVVLAWLMRANLRLDELLPARFRRAAKTSVVTP
jgi:O-antigen/teichoic acid export membrane protein